MAVNVDDFLPIMASMYIDVASYCVSAPLSWQRSHVMSLEVMATVQINDGADEEC